MNASANDLLENIPISADTSIQGDKIQHTLKTELSPDIKHLEEPGMLIK